MAVQRAHLSKFRWSESPEGPPRGIRGFDGKRENYRCQAQRIRQVNLALLKAEPGSVDRLNGTRHCLWKLHPSTSTHKPERARERIIALVLVTISAFGA